MDNIMSLLQTSIILNSRTGDPIKDSFIMIFMMLLSKYIIEYFPKMISFLNNKINFKNKIKSEFLIQGTITISTEYCSHVVNFPEEYRAIMFKISTLGIDIKYGRQFNNADKYNHTSNNNLFSYSLNTDDEIKIVDDIFVKQSNNTDKSNDLKSSIEFYNLFIYSYKLDFCQLKKVIDSWIEEYKKFIKEYNDGNIYYFSYVEYVQENQEVKFESHPFSSNKNFNNIFFNEKELLKKRIDYFLNNKKEYEKLGIPYTLGLMFYGNPGCGKTSTIKAIANYTKRHIIEISLSKIKTCSELKKVFFQDLVCGHYVPSNKKIIVLEDIDCMGSIIDNRSDDFNKEKNDSHNRQINILNNPLPENQLVNGKQIMTEEQSKDRLNLSFILNLLDGVLEQHGRIIILTTNFPDKIDKALLRPGRIDMKVNFTECESHIVLEIIEFFFETKLSDSIIEQIDKINKKYTPAEIFQLCFNYNNLEQVIEKLEENYVQKDV